MTLSPQQRNVLLLYACGWTWRRIGTRLFMSHNTVHFHMQQILTRLGAYTIAHAVAIAMTSTPAIITPDEMRETLQKERKAGQ